MNQPEILPSHGPKRKEGTLILIDGNALMHRSYHGMQKGFIPHHEGMPVGMVYGFANTFVRILQEGIPDYCIITFDTKEKTFRHELDPEYKAHRQKTPDDFYAQMPLLMKMVESTGSLIYKKPGFESDDLIGTLAIEARKKDLKVEIYSGDLDFLQLVGDEGITLMKYAHFGSAIVPYNTPETIARFGVHPSQIVDYKAIAGDSSDNYKGIPGVGPKTTKALFEKYKTLDEIYEHLDEMRPKMREKFKENKSYVYHCQELAKIHTSVEIDLPFDTNWTLNVSSFETFLQSTKFNAIQRRLNQMIHKSAQQEPEKKPQKNEDQMSLF